MRTARPAGWVFFPLDRELELLAGDYTPTLVEHMVRLGTRMEFAPAAAELLRLKKVHIAEPTVRRDTEKAGGAYVAAQTAQLAGLEAELPVAPRGPAVQQMSVDGAMVPLLHGEWAEVKTVAIGTIGPPVLEHDQWVVHATDMSYFSRLADHETFTRAATIETHRRGTETAGTVCAVNDGADWEQKFVDVHRPDAVRILDWAHGAEHLAAAGQAAFGAGTEALSAWIGSQLHELTHGDPQTVLAELRRLSDDPSAVPGGLPSGARAIVQGTWEYLEKRREQIRYAAFRAAGYPIGSGAVESGNKVVVEARLKGAGMHWERGHVDGMLALRDALCSDRWDEAWAQASAQLQQRARERADERRARRREAQIVDLERQILALICSATIGRTGAERMAPSTPLADPIPVDEPQTQPRRPAASHPWRRPLIRRPQVSTVLSPACTEI